MRIIFTEYVSLTLGVRSPLSKKYPREHRLIPHGLTKRLCGLTKAIHSWIYSLVLIRAVLAILSFDYLNRGNMTNQDCGSVERS